MKKPLFLITGQSGSGKSALATELSAKYGYKLAKSYTTRKPRTPDETAYHFVDPMTFQRFKDMTNVTLYHNNSYGIRISDLLSVDLYIVDPAGIRYMKQHHTNIFDIYVIGVTATAEECASRMRNRGDNPDSVRSRIENDKLTFNIPTSTYDIIIHNHDLDDTVELAHNFIERMTARTNNIVKQEADIAKHNFDFLVNMSEKHGSKYGHMERQTDGTFCGMIDDDIIIAPNLPGIPVVPEKLLLNYRQQPFVIQPYFVGERLVNMTVKLVNSPDPLFMVDTPYPILGKKASDENGPV